MIYIGFIGLLSLLVGKIAKLYSRVALFEQRLQDYENIGLAFSELTAKCQAERAEANKYKNLI